MTSKRQPHQPLAFFCYLAFSIPLTSLSKTGEKHANKNLLCVTTVEEIPLNPSMMENTGCSHSNMQYVFII